jgi:hypothetical protein
MVDVGRVPEHPPQGGIDQRVEVDESAVLPEACASDPVETSYQRATAAPRSLKAFAMVRPGGGMAARSVT